MRATMCGRRHALSPPSLLSLGLRLCLCFVSLYAVADASGCVLAQTWHICVVDVAKAMAGQGEQNTYCDTNGTAPHSTSSVDRIGESFGLLLRNLNYDIWQVYIDGMRVRYLRPDAYARRLGRVWHFNPVHGAEWHSRGALCDGS